MLNIKYLPYPRTAENDEKLGFSEVKGWEYGCKLRIASTDSSRYSDNSALVEGMAASEKGNGKVLWASRAR